MDHIKNDIDGKQPEDWVAWNRLQSIKKHCGALLWAADDEVALQISQNRAIKGLVNNIRARTKMAKVNHNDEELNRITEKFQCPKLHKLSEEWLWDECKNGSNWKCLARSLRDRHTLLMTVQTCTRHEATLSCMLQGMEFVKHQLQGETEPCDTLMRNVCKGKTNQENQQTILQAKSIRHKHAHLCEQGALAMCLFARFRVHDEEFDLSDNKKWMQVKTTVSLNNSKQQFEVSRTKKMCEGPFHSKLDTVFQSFGFNMSHVVHFGRSCSPVLLEFASVVITAIETLGNWCQNTCNKSHSLNLPWEALRAAAGFKKDINFYRNTRSCVKVPSRLKRKVFPNVERARVLHESLSEEQQLQAKMGAKFLRVMDHLAEVFVQDVCELRMTGRDRHLLFTDPFFWIKISLSTSNFSDKNTLATVIPAMTRP